MIRTRNQVPVPGSKIHCPVPNPGNWYPFFALTILMKLMKILLLAAFVAKFSTPREIQLHFR